MHNAQLDMRTGRYYNNDNSMKIQLREFYGKTRITKRMDNAQAHVTKMQMSD